MLVIAGSPVAVGDQLFITRVGAFGSVVSLGDNTARVEVMTTGGARQFLVEPGGMVHGTRGAFWHPPLQLDMPKGSQSKLAAIETVVGALLQVL
jgi:hypothetical protein